MRLCCAGGCPAAAGACGWVLRGPAAGVSAAFPEAPPHRLLPRPSPLCPPANTRSFKDAIGAGRISAVEAMQECCVLAAVGQKMASRRGVAATMFAALAKANINIR